MTAPMDADVQLRASLDELLVVAAGAQRTATADPVFAYEHAWFARTIDTIRAALVLHDNGFGEVAAPLIRTGLEHAVGLRWLLTVGEDGIETLAKAHQKWAQDVLKSKSAADQNESAHGRKDWSPEMTRALEEVIARAVPSNPTNRDANHLQRFETAGAFDLYVAWLSETGYSHAAPGFGEAVCRRWRQALPIAGATPTRTGLRRDSCISCCGRGCDVDGRGTRLGPVERKDQSTIWSVGRRNGSSQRGRVVRCALYRGLVSKVRPEAIAGRSGTAAGLEDMVAAALSVTVRIRGTIEHLF